MTIADELREDADKALKEDGIYFSGAYLDGVARRAMSEQAENSKLRKLCERFAEYVSQDRCEGCVVKRRCDDGDVDECWQRTELRDMAHELGIEVD